MTQPDIPVTPTQEDRDRVQQWLDNPVGLVDLFALHRTKAEQRAREEALEEAAKEAEIHRERLEDENDAYANMPPERASTWSEKAKTADFIATTIRSLMGKSE